MKFNIQQTELNTALQHLVRNTDNKFPAFKGITIKAENSNIVLSASNGVVNMEYRLDCIIEEKEPVSISAQKFYEVVSRLKGLITFDNGLIFCGKNKIKLPLNEEIIETKIEDIENPVELKAKELKNALKGRIFAAEKFMAQNILSGICLNGEDVIATDGNIMALCKVPMLPFKKIVIDLKLANEIVKVLNDDEIINIGFSGNKIIIKSKNLSISSHLKIGEFPNYSGLFPVCDNVVLINKAEILNLLEINKMMTNEKNICFLNLEKGKLIVGTNDSTSEMDISYDNEKIKIWFNINYLLECFKNITGEKVLFGFSSPYSACLIEAGNEKTLIMPVRNNNA